MRDTTLCFLVKEKDNKIHKICLAMKKRGFGEGRWNGSGGKVEDKTGETIEEALVREVSEEIGVKINNFDKKAELTFNFPHNKDWDQLCHVYFVRDWKGEPSESEEMAPKWFKREEIPFDSMWPDDVYWLPHVLEDSLIKANFVFGENDDMLEKNIDIVDSL